MLNHKGEQVKVGDKCYWCCGSGRITARRIEIEQRIDDYVAQANSRQGVNK